MRTVIHYLAVLMMGIGLTGCQASSMKYGAETADLAGSMWRLISLDGLGKTDAAATTLHFEDKTRLSGSDGCNSYRGSYSASDTSLKIADNMMATMMACPQAIERQASAFKNALKNSASFAMDDQQLRLLDANGQLVAEFEAVSQLLSGTSWEVTGYNNGRQAVVSVMAGSKITVSFGADGKVTGAAGCNRYFASYKQNGGKLTIGPPGATRMFCADPAGLMEQEQSFLAALQSANSLQLAGDRLTLRTEKGAIAISLSR